MGSRTMGFVVGVSLVLAVATVVWSQERAGGITEAERVQRIQQLAAQRDKIREELRDLQKQPEGTATSTVPRSELRDQPIRNMKESLESVPATLRQGHGARDLNFSIRGSGH